VDACSKLLLRRLGHDSAPTVSRDEVEAPRTTGRDTSPFHAASQEQVLEKESATAAPPSSRQHHLSLRGLLYGLSKDLLRAVFTVYKTYVIEPQTMAYNFYEGESYDTSWIATAILSFVTIAVWYLVLFDNGGTWAPGWVGAGILG